MWYKVGNLAKLYYCTAPNEFNVISIQKDGSVLVIWCAP